MIRLVGNAKFAVGLFPAARGAAALPAACICRLVQAEDRYAGVMPRAWSRLHEHLGRPPGPITFDMVRRCLEGKLAEADDLDWKALHKTV
jgi:hypothetical protein